MAGERTSFGGTFLLLSKKSSRSTQVSSATWLVPALLSSAYYVSAACAEPLNKTKQKNSLRVGRLLIISYRQKKKKERKIKEHVKENGIRNQKLGSPSRRVRASVAGRLYTYKLFVSRSERLKKNDTTESRTIK